MGSITKQAKNITQTAGNKIKQISKEANYIAEEITITSYKDNIQIAAPGGKVSQTAKQGIRYASDPPEDRIPYATVPKLKGQVIFCNGFHSSIGGVLNAMISHVPGIDKPSFLSKLLNTDAENNHHKKGSIDTLDKHADAIPVEMNKDVETNEEVIEQEKIVKEYIQMTKEFKKKHGINYKVDDDPIYASSKEIEYSSKVKTAKKALDHFKAYWNDKDNHNKAVNLYTNFFNAREYNEKGEEIEERDNYINGSHGMGSPAWERLCHAIAHGYYWAAKNWGIKPKAAVDKAKENNPGADSYSPAYMPLTIVGHSEGNAAAIGTCVGIIYYANEMGWTEIPINVILLSIHQPVSFMGELYETYKKIKCDWFETNTNVPFGTLIKDMLHTKAHKEDHRTPFGMKLGKILDKDKNKQDDGIDEWMQKLVGKEGWDKMKTRAVQFSFVNDKADTVALQGDIPGIANACQKTELRNKTLGFGIDENLEHNKTSISSINFYTKSQMNTRILIKFADNKKLGEAEKQYDDENNEIRTELEVVYRKDTYEYWVKEFFGRRNIYIDAAEAYEQKNGINWRDGLAKYNQQMSDIEQYRIEKEEEMLDSQVNFRFPIPKMPQFERPPTANEDLAEAWDVQEKYYNMIDAYAWIHHVELEAHFAPVAWINRPEIFYLPDGSDRDHANWPMGEGETIWERITKTAEKNGDLFYRVNYTKKDNESDSDKTTKEKLKKITEPEKRDIEKKYVDEHRSKCIPTNFVNNPEVKKWIALAKKEL